MLGLRSVHWRIRKGAWRIRQGWFLACSENLELDGKWIVERKF
jgi:hypothetical protein